MSSIKNNLTGRKIGRWTVGQPIHGNKKLKLKLRYNCVCDCGSVRKVQGSELLRGKSLSCGCMRSEKLLLRPFEALYNKFKRVSENQGIKVDLTYKQFLKFTSIQNCHYCAAELLWLPNGYTPKKHRQYGPTNLDRKNPNLGYTKNNVVVCCTRCNLTKSNRFTYEQFVKIGNAIKTFTVSANEEAVVVTYSGAAVNLLNPQPETILITDIAKSLSCIPRYNGHTTKPYFVGDHCVLMARLFLLQQEQKLAKYALLHDAAEFVYQDISHPLKYSKGMEHYRLLEKLGQQVIYRKFGLTEAEPVEVKSMDTLLVNNEKRDLCPNRLLDHGVEFYPNVKIIPWGPEKTEREFLKMYNELFGDEFGIVEIP